MTISPPVALQTNADMRVRLAWEHTHRELLPALILLNGLEKRGIPYALEHVTALGACRPGPEVVFLPFYYDESDFDRYLFRGGFEHKWVVNLAYEQMHFLCGRPYLLPDGPFAREHMLHCAWGERFRELLQAHGVPDERIRVVGHPRFDLYRRPELLLGRADLAARYGLDPDRPWLLVPYNFNLAYVTRALVARLQARGYALTDAFIDGVRRARDAFTALVRTLCDRFRDHEVILRVHPAGYEAETIYKDEARARPNLRLIAHYDIANWITQAALTIVWNSTSAMEAMAAGRPVVSYEPEPFSETFDYDVNRIVPTFRTVDEVVDVVRAGEGAPLRYDWERFDGWYRWRDGRCAERLCDVVREAQEGYERFRARATRAGGWRGRWRRRAEALAAPLPAAVAPAVRGVLGLATRAHGGGPPAAALAAAVSTLSPAPLDGFLK
ncbi:MAG TPA: hypothetical protein VG389_03825 [Myxococcota bacterium]|jgi:hypothetical protein|nr:hypothetical protein [Myxococcota bacterium]